MDKKFNKVLLAFKEGRLSIEEANRLLLYLTGLRKTMHCKLDRPKTECSIFKNTTGGCSNCGHHYEYDNYS